MATTAVVNGARWTDKPTARFLIGALGIAAMSAVSGATWLVKTGVDTKVQEARYEEHFKAIDKTLDGQSADIKEMKADLKELVRREPK